MEVVDGTNGGGDKRLCTGPRTTSVVAGLQGHHRGATPGFVPRVCQSHDLRMRPTRWLSVAHAYDLTGRIEDDRTDGRVGARRTTRLCAGLHGEAQRMLDYW